MRDWLTPSSTPHDYWLVFNECENAGQCDAAPEEAADFYHNEIVRTVIEWGGDPNAQLIVGGVNAHQCGIAWLERFVQSYEKRYGPLPRAGWHFHIYPEVAPAEWYEFRRCEGNWSYRDQPFLTPTPTGVPEASLWPLWQDHAENMKFFLWRYGTPDDEIWLTETGCLRSMQTHTPACELPGSMYLYTSRITEWLNNEGRWVNRYAWYTEWDLANWEQTKLYDVTRTPTPTPDQWLNSVGESPNLAALGVYYTQVTPAAPVTLAWVEFTHTYYMPFVRDDED